MQGSKTQPSEEIRLVICTTQMALEGIMLSKVSQTEEDKHYMTSLICGIKTTSQQTNRNRTVSIENELVVAREVGGGRMGQMDKGIWELQASSYGKNKSRDKRYNIGSIVHALLHPMVTDGSCAQGEH